MKADTLRDKTKAELVDELDDLRQRLAESEKSELERRRMLDALRVSEEKHRILLDESSDPIFAFSPEGRYRYVNQAFADGVGKRLEQIVGSTIWDVFPQEEADKRFAIVKWVFENGETKVIEVRVPRVDGDRYYVTTAKPILDHERRVISVICISKDITERKQAEQMARDAALQWQSTFDVVDDAICMLDAQQKILKSNSAMDALAFAPPEGLVGRHCWEVVHGTSEPIPECPMQRMRSSLHREHMELRAGDRWMEVTVDPVLGKEGVLQGAVHIMRDITVRKQMEEKVSQLALHDMLTDLPNRRLLNDRLKQTMAAGKRSGCYSAIMFLDLDNFKQINDAYGHAVGDSLLIEVAERLKSCVREVDTVARFGGDEFVVMITELDADRAASLAQTRVIAEKISAALAKPCRLQVRGEGVAESTVEHQCTASIGVALFGKDEANQEDVLKWADAAMYRAKEAGSNLIRISESKA